MALLADQLGVAYRKEHIFFNLDLEIHPGSLTLIMGESGSGKSTLLKALAGLYPQYGGKLSGSVSLDGRKLTEIPANKRAVELALLFQNPKEQFAMPTVEEELAFALENIQVDEKNIEQRIDLALKKVGIAEFRNRSLQTLSGGELQKVALAEVLALRAQYILLDEPFASVDQQSRKDLQELLYELSKEGYAVVVADHEWAGYADKMSDFYRFDDGQLNQVAQDNWPAEVKPIDYPLSKPKNSHTIFTAEFLRIRNDHRLLIFQEELAIHEGEVILITGPNGSGKSTFLKALAKLQEYEGSIRFEGKVLKKWKAAKYYRRVGLVFQEALDQFLSITVAEEIEQVLANSYEANYWTRDRVDCQLHELGLGNLLRRSVYTLSGGQQKKLQVVLMLIMAPQVLLLDEPLAGLDEHSVQKVLALIHHCQREFGLTVIYVSHQVEPILPYIDRHLQLEQHQLVEEKELAQ